MNDLEHILKQLSDSRPVFHNEMDFQFSLAWEIQKKHPDYKIRFEKRFTDYDDDLRRIDLWIIDGEDVYAIELKYPTKNAIFKINNEIFKLKNQSAEDYSRYDFLKDVQRMEEATANTENIRGYAILITNNLGISIAPTKNDVADFHFRIYDGRIINNQELEWIRKEGGQSFGDRESSITLKGNYEFRWKDYSEIKEKNIVLSNGKFQYLFIEINS